jgi:hypothetical protein
MLFFGLASPNFLQTDNLVAILQATPSTACSRSPAPS